MLYFFVNISNFYLKSQYIQYIQSDSKIKYINIRFVFGSLFCVKKTNKNHLCLLFQFSIHYYFHKHISLTLETLVSI